MAGLLPGYAGLCPFFRSVHTIRSRWRIGHPSKPDGASIAGRASCHLTDLFSVTIVSIGLPRECRLLIRELCILIHPKAGASDSNIVMFGGRWKG